MGGARRHHYVPDFLLRRFAVRGASRDFIVRGLVRGNVCEVNTKKIGVIGMFHRCAGLSRSPEAVLSGFEDDLARETAHWETGPLDAEGVEAARELVRHLRTRSPRVRELFAHLAGGIGGVMEQAVHEALPDSPPPRSLADELSRVFSRAAIQNHDDLAAQQQALLSMVPEVVGRHMRWAMVSALRGLVTSARLLDLVEQVHTAQVIQSLHQSATDALDELAWEVIAVPTGSLLLGDGAPIARYGREEQFFELFQRDRPLEMVALPVAPGRLLVGRRAGVAAPSADSVNHAMITLSREFVVGRWSRAQFESVRGEFGSAVDVSLMRRLLATELEPTRNEIRSALGNVSAQLDAFLARATGVPRGAKPASAPRVTVVAHNSVSSPATAPPTAHQ